jgi:hypothetical protein
VFTARYGLIPYMKQITFRLKKVNHAGILSLLFMLMSCICLVLINEYTDPKCTEWTTSKL